MTQTIEQLEARNAPRIEQETAEACAKYCRARSLNTREAILNANRNTAEHIQLRREARSGEADDCAIGLVEGKWREYL